MGTYLGSRTKHSLQVFHLLHNHAEFTQLMAGLTIFLQENSIERTLLLLDPIILQRTKTTWDVTDCCQIMASWTPSKRASSCHVTYIVPNSLVFFFLLGQSARFYLHTIVLPPTPTDDMARIFSLTPIPLPGIKFTLAQLHLLEGPWFLMLS